MKNYILISLLIFFSICCNKHSAQETPSKTYSIENAEQILPKNRGWVNDFASVFNDEEVKTLDAFLQNYSNQTTNQIAIVTVNNIKPYTNINDFSTDLGNYWGVGIQEKNNGVLFVLSMEDRTMKIATGDRVESILTDDYLKNLLDSTIIPKFQEGKFYEGIRLGLDEMSINWK